MLRKVCSQTAAGCARCQLARRPHSGGALLLAPANPNAQAATEQALRDADFPFRRHGGVLVLPAGDDPPSLVAMLGRHLSPATQQDTRAVFFQGDLHSPTQALTAFIGAEPLSAMMARQEHEWVRQALNDGWLFSHFHPIVDARTLTVFAHEALIRARHPKTQEIIGAGPIIHACNQLDLMHVLDQRARQTAIRNATALGQASGRYFINFLPNTIYDPEICLRTTMETAAECGMDISHLVFEVVETEDIPDMTRLRYILDYYRARGVGTAVDDMGAGFSSLQYLTALRPDYVKLDRGILVEAEQGRAALQKMQTVINTAKDLGIDVIAEGIETIAQMDLCLDSRVDYMQGFLFARPANPPQSITVPSAPLRMAA